MSLTARAMWQRDRSITLPWSPSMTSPAPPAASPPIVSIGDAFTAMLAGFRQVGDGLYTLSLALLHHAASFAWQPAF